MNLNKENFVFSLINKTSTSFYSTSSFLQKRVTLSTLSNTKKFNKYKKISLKNYHKIFLKKKLLDKDKYLLTETSKNQIFLTKILNNDNLLDNEENSERYKSLSKRSFIQIKTKNFKMYDNFSQREESLSDFKLKIKYGRNAKFLLKTLRREKENALEKQKTEIEDIEYKIVQIHYMKDLFIKYINQLIKYCKFLSNELDKEKQILKKIILQESKIKNLVKKLNNQIENKKLEIIKGENYRNFLLFVKYKVTQVKDLPKDIIDLYQLDNFLPQEKKKFMSKGSVNIVRKSFNKNFKKKNTLIKKRTSVAIDKNFGSEKIKTLIIKDSKKPPPLIYTSLEEYNYDIQKIKIDLINLFNYHNEQMKELEELKNEKKSFLVDEKLTNNNLLYQIKKCENKLINVKNENIKLQNTLNKIGSIECQSLFKNKIGNKLFSIIMKLPINVEKEYHCPNFYITLSSKSEKFLYNGKKQDTVLFCIKILEQIIISIITKLNYFNLNEKNRNFISDIKNKIEIENRKSLNRSNLQNEREKINKLREKINKKMNKVLYLPRRKVNIINTNSNDYRSKSEDKKNQKDIDNDLTFENLIY